MRRAASVELRGKRLHGVLIQEGRAASGGRAEVFAPGSVEWPTAGVGILTRHRAAPEVRAIPRREPDGRIVVEADATPAIREAVEGGRRYMSVEFHALEERTTKGGVREILRALVPDAALVAAPEYDVTGAEVRRGGGVSGSIPLHKPLRCTCKLTPEGQKIITATVADIDVGEVLGYAFDVKRPLGRVVAKRKRDRVDLTVDVPEGLSYGADLLALSASGVPLSFRPFPNLEASEFTVEGSHATYTKLVPWAWIVLPRSLSGELPEAKVESRGLSLRKRLLIAGAV